jgi:hypothetical protein
MVVVARGEEEPAPLSRGLQIKLKRCCASRATWPIVGVHTKVLKFRMVESSSRRNKQPVNQVHMPYDNWQFGQY